MKKQANVFGIVALVCAALGLILKLILGIVNEFSLTKFVWEELETSEILSAIVVLIFCTALPIIIVGAVQILFSIFALKPVRGKKSVLNLIVIILQAFAFPIISPLISAGVTSLLLDLFGQNIYVIYHNFLNGNVADVLVTISSYAIIAANAFAIGQKKLGEPEKLMTEEE